MRIYFHKARGHRTTINLWIWKRTQAVNGLFDIKQLRINAAIWRETLLASPSSKSEIFKVCTAIAKLCHISQVYLGWMGSIKLDFCWCVSWYAGRCEFLGQTYPWYKSSLQSGWLHGNSDGIQTQLNCVKHWISLSSSNPNQKPSNQIGITN